MDAEWRAYFGLPETDDDEGSYAPPGLGSFTEFCESIDVTLTPGQYAISLVAYDGLSIEEADGALACKYATNRPNARMASDFFGGSFPITDIQRRIFVAVCGARAGKTYALTALRLLHLALTVPLTSLAPGEEASAPIIAPDKSLALQALRYCKGALAHKRLRHYVPDLEDLNPNTERESIALRRPDGRVEIVCRAASGRGVAGRGRSLVSAAMDEAAFFRDSNYKVNDQEIYDALAPRILPGGQLLVCSTPWAQSGMVHALFAQNHAKPSAAGLASTPRVLGSALACHAPSTALREDEAFHQIVALEYRRDAENAEREFGACFMASTALDFLDPVLIQQSLYADAFVPKAGDQLVAGIDLGFRSNSSALVIAYLRERHVWVAVVEERRPELGLPLKPSLVMGEFARLLEMRGCNAVMADAHYRETAVEYLSAVRIGLLDAPGPAEVWLKTRDLLREGRLHIPASAERLLRQLREVKAKPGSGGALSIFLPHWPTGEHGDIAAAFSLALYQAAGQSYVEPVAAGSQEALRLEEERRKAARRREVQNGNQPLWKRAMGR